MTLFSWHITLQIEICLKKKKGKKDSNQTFTKRICNERKIFSSHLWRRILIAESSQSPILRQCNWKFVILLPILLILCQRSMAKVRDVITTWQRIDLISLRFLIHFHSTSQVLFTLFRCEEKNYRLNKNI